MKKQLNYIFLILATVALITTGATCGSSSKITQGKDLIVKEAYLQKEYPGQRDAEIRDCLKIDFEKFDQKAIVIDSVYYASKVYKVGNAQLSQKLIISRGKAVSNSQFKNESKNMATIFYHKQETSYYISMEGIQRKEALYLP